MRVVRTPVLFFALVASCVAPIPFDTVKLDAEPSVRTGVDATLQLVKGVATSEVPVIVPFGGNRLPSETTNFGAEEQIEFGELLRSELVRLEVFAAMREGRKADPEPVHVTFAFRGTHYRPSYHQLTIDAQLTIDHDGRVFERSYEIDSNAGESGWELANSNLYESRIRAVRKLLAAVVPDVQGWAAGVVP